MKQGAHSSVTAPEVSTWLLHGPLLPTGNCAAPLLAETRSLANSTALLLAQNRSESPPTGFPHAISAWQPGHGQEGGAWISVSPHVISKQLTQEMGKVFQWQKTSQHAVLLLIMSFDTAAN